MVVPVAFPPLLNHPPRLAVLRARGSSRRARRPSHSGTVRGGFAAGGISRAAGGSRDRRHRGAFSGHRTSRQFVLRLQSKACQRRPSPTFAHGASSPSAPWQPSPPPRRSSWRSSSCPSSTASGRRRFAQVPAGPGAGATLLVIAWQVAQRRRVLAPQHQPYLRRPPQPRGLHPRLLFLHGRRRLFPQVSGSCSSTVRVEVDPTSRVPSEAPDRGRGRPRTPHSCAPRDQALPPLGLGRFCASGRTPFLSR